MHKIKGLECMLIETVQNEIERKETKIYKQSISELQYQSHFICVSKGQGEMRDTNERD